MADVQEVARTIVLLVENHSIMGDVRLGEARLSDFLNDLRQPCIELHNATVSRLSEPAKAISRTDRALIPKAKVAVAFEVKTSRAANAQRLFNYKEKVKYLTFAAAGTIEIQGLFHATPSESPADLMLAPKRWFIPLTKAVVTI